MTRLGHPLPSIMVLLSVECYLRPSEALSLTGQSLLPPTTSAVPHWVVLLFPQREQTTVQSWGRGRHSGDRLGTGKLDAKSLPGACEPRAVPTAFQTDTRRSSKFSVRIEAVPYQMRHPGPSLDLAQGIRDITSCQKRGRWATMTSLKRYEKHGRLNDTWRLLSPGTQAYCLTCEHDAEGFILAGKTCPLPPRLVQ